MTNPVDQLSDLVPRRGSLQNCGVFLALRQNCIAQNQDLGFARFKIGYIDVHRLDNLKPGKTLCRSGFLPHRQRPDLLEVTDRILQHSWRETQSWPQPPADNESKPLRSRKGYMVKDAPAKE